MKSINNSHIPVLDSLRAFAAISVCLYHFVCTTTNFITTEWVLNFFSIGKYGVQLFFVISGFVIPWAMYHAKYEIKNFLSFFLKRLSRLEPPYVFSILLALVIVFFREQLFGLTNEHINAKQIVLHFGYLIPFFDGYKWLNQVYWTLAIEFQYYIFIGVLFIPLIKSKLIVRMFFYLFILIISHFGTSAFLFNWLPIFLIGILLFMYKANFILNKEYYFVSFFILFFCFYKYSFVSVCYITLPVILILLYSDFKLNFLNYFGKMSYSIYLIHPFIGASIINFFSHDIQSAIGKVGLISIGLVATLIFSYLMYIFIEKPSKKLSGSIKYKL